MYKLSILFHIVPYCSMQRLLKHLLFEQSFTRYKTYVIIACAKSIESESD